MTQRSAGKSLQGSGKHKEPCVSTADYLLCSQTPKPAGAPSILMTVTAAS